MALRTEKEKMLAGELYDPADSDLQAEIEANHRWLVRYNASQHFTLCYRVPPC